MRGVEKERESKAHDTNCLSCLICKYGSVLVRMCLVVPLVKRPAIFPDQVVSHVHHCGIQLASTWTQSGVHQMGLTLTSSDVHHMELGT